jgi:hypothetical protein
MRPVWRRMLWSLAIAAVSLPLSIASTLMLIPLWRWIEATYGIESIGHSGPADWCFELNLSVWFIAGLFILWTIDRRRSPQPHR